MALITGKSSGPVAMKGSPVGRAKPRRRPGAAAASSTYNKIIKPGVKKPGVF